MQTKSSLRILFMLLLTSFSLLLFYSCQKEDRNLSTEENAALKKNNHLSAKEQESADFVYDWYKFLAQLQLPEPASAPPVNFRNFAYIGVGLFESVQPGIKGGSSFSPKLYQMPAMPKPNHSKDYFWSASANAAMASMVKLFLTNLTIANTTSIDSMEAAQYNHFKSMASEEVLQRSQAFGRSIATAIYNWSTTDNFTLASVGWVPPVFPGSWVPTSTPPAIVGAFLGESRPMLRYSLNALAPPIPVPYSTDPSSEFYKAAKEVYDIGVSQNAAQQATARWWADVGGPGVGYPAPYHLTLLITSILESHNAGLWKAAEVYAKTGIGMKDGGIITFRSKYHYNLLRPITYIRQNLDANWNSLLPSPAYPEYTSGLVGFYGPIIQVLIREFGDIPITDNTYTWRGLPARHYNSLGQLLKEASDSRLYAGIHYRFTQDISVQVGIELGNEIAKVRVVGPEY